MSGLKPKIGAKQEAAVLALLSSKNVEEAARAAGVTPRTLYRWMSEADFDAAYRAAPSIWAVDLAPATRVYGSRYDSAQSHGRSGDAAFHARACRRGGVEPSGKGD
jgi:hypothetical protein